jgi:glycine dehydrogenase
MKRLPEVERFEDRHNGVSEMEMKEMLETIGCKSLDELIDQTIPSQIRLKEDLQLPGARSEKEYLNDLKAIASKNKVYDSYIGMGYYPTHTPAVIKRNILENPGWYTAYTPYQAEIAQGRLEALINYQTMVMDLTAMELANASLLDEGTAAAEAMSMFFHLRKKAKKEASVFLVDENTFPQTIDVLKTRAEPLGIELEIVPITVTDISRPEVFGMLLQYPDAKGNINAIDELLQQGNEHGIFSTVAADLMSLVLLDPPGSKGAHAVVGNTQRFGVPMGYGGPHAAFFATKEEYKRHIPGRIIGRSQDKFGNTGYRMALQTREQHIKRERATSNICTAQVLLAVMAGMYSVYHGKKGLTRIAERIHGLACLAEEGLNKLGFKQENEYFFDTLHYQLDEKTVKQIKSLAEAKEINLRYFPGGKAVGISMDETKSIEDINKLIGVFEEVSQSKHISYNSSSEYTRRIGEKNQRTSDFLTAQVFNHYRTEHDMLRYIKRLENKDVSLVHSMISLGSCTMKLNATTEMEPVSWPEFSSLHPYVPIEQAQGYKELIESLDKWLSEITGFHTVTVQPNSGAQGEYSGLMVIRAYHHNNGDYHRNIALIPSSAHGTNPASAVMAGMKVVIVNCDDHGNVDIEDLRAKAEAHSENLGALMVTYPSTHGVFEEDIQEICDIIHQHGGQVYMDGANMNAQVGYTSPYNIGADVCHLNLHKTFCIPHGGGGPGVGPIGVRDHLAPFLPGNPLVQVGGEKAMSAVSSAPWGSASILPISYGYISMMGAEGLKNATAIAILNANYIMERVKDHFKILYTGKNGRSAHEMIIDCRQFKEVGIEVEDIAKRLMDYGFHAPTVSFPVPGTMMIEPTESESKQELDRFCDALISIRSEISEIEAGIAEKEVNVLKNAPHTAQVVTASEWSYPYTREKAAFPLNYLYSSKIWPGVSRVDNAYGDRNLVCSCLPLEEYQEESEIMMA